MAKDRVAPLLFTAGDVLAWERAGRRVAGATLLAAPAYEPTPLKDVCLRKCCSPLGFLLGAWRDGRAGALGMGVRHGAWCVGCCWAPMASLFALGVMNIVWMAFVAALIAAEKTLPRPTRSPASRHPEITQCFRCSRWARRASDEPAYPGQLFRGL